MGIQNRRARCVWIPSGETAELDGAFAMLWTSVHGSIACGCVGIPAGIVTSSSLFRHRHRRSSLSLLAHPLVLLLPRLSVPYVVHIQVHFSCKEHIWQLICLFWNRATQSSKIGCTLVGVQASQSSTQTAEFGERRRPAYVEDVFGVISGCFSLTRRWMRRCTFQPVSGDDDERKVQDNKRKREEEIRRRRRRRRMKRDGEFSDQGGVEKIFAARML